MLAEIPAHDIFKIIHLDLAREPGHPQGSADDRYTLILPLDAEGYIDPDSCRSFPDLCRVAHASFRNEVVDVESRSHDGGTEHLPIGAGMKADRAALAAWMLLLAGRAQGGTSG